MPAQLIGRFRVSVGCGAGEWRTVRTPDVEQGTIVSWTEHTYNHRRHQSGLGRLTPVEFEVVLVLGDYPLGHLRRILIAVTRPATRSA